jgi:putative ABC transport system ATP-binding protein
MRLFDRAKEIGAIRADQGSQRPVQEKASQDRGAEMQIYDRERRQFRGKDLNDPFDAPLPWEERAEKEGQQVRSKEKPVIIQVRRVSKTFGSGETATRALKEVSLTVKMGEMVSIMGPSGCGKSTLLHILAGIEKADEGEIWIDGVPLHRLSEQMLSDLRLNRMGFVFQQFHLIPVLTALENIALPLVAKGLSDREAKRRARAALEQVGLADKANRYPSELSGGQNQRVAIARALVARPKIVWADEPTGALDSQTADMTIGLLRRINEAYGTTIVIVTHDPAVAKQTDRIILMENGRVLGERVGAGA